MIIRIIRSCFGLIKLTIIKLFHYKQFYFSPFSFVDPSIRIEFRGTKAKLVLGKGFKSRSNVILRVSGQLTIGDNVFINDSCKINCDHLINIGNDSIFGPNVLMFDDDYDYTSKDLTRLAGWKHGQVSIGEDVWVGANVVILRNAVIGSHSVVGAGALVKEVIPERSLAHNEHKLIIKNIIK